MNDRGLDQGCEGLPVFIMLILSFRHSGHRLEVPADFHTRPIMFKQESGTAARFKSITQCSSDSQSGPGEATVTPVFAPPQTPRLPAVGAKTLPVCGSRRLDWPTLQYTVQVKHRW